MTEQQNWELMGAVFKADAEDLRADRKKVINAINDLKETLQAVLVNSEVTTSEFNAINTLLELAK